MKDPNPGYGLSVIFFAVGSSIIDVKGVLAVTMIDRYVGVSSGMKRFVE